MPSPLRPLLLLPALLLLPGCAFKRMIGEWDIVLWEAEGADSSDVTDDAGWLHFSNDTDWNLSYLLRYQWDGEVLVPIEHPVVENSGFTKASRKKGQEFDAAGATWVFVKTGTTTAVVEAEGFPEGGRSTWTLEH